MASAGVPVARGANFHKYGWFGGWVGCDFLGMRLRAGTPPPYFVGKVFDSGGLCWDWSEFVCSGACWWKTSSSRLAPDQERLSPTPLSV